MSRYRKLGYVALNVSNLSASEEFYEKVVGLQHNGRSHDGKVFFRCSDDHHNLVLSEGEPGLRRLGWQMESQEDVSAIETRAREAGMSVTEVAKEESDSLSQDRTVRVVEPNTGLVMEFYSSIAKEDSAFTASVAKIQRLGHVVLRTPEVLKATETALDVFNFRQSDEIDGLVQFLRCFPNPFHHSLAYAKNKENGLHHVNFMVTEIDDVGRAVNRFKKNNVPIVYGPGKHPPSESIFLYFLDPDGMTIEYSLGMETFPESQPRDHRVLAAAPTSFDYWGGVPDPRMGTVGAISARDLVS